MNENNNNNLDNTLNIKPDVNIMDAINNNQVQNNPVESNTQVPENNTVNIPVQDNVVEPPVQAPINNPVNTPVQNNQVEPSIPAPSNDAASTPVQNTVEPSTPAPANNAVSTPTTSNNKSSNAVLFIILGIFIFLIIAVLGFILIYSLIKNSNGGIKNTPIKRTTEYNITSNNSTTTTTKVTSNGTIEFKGITFNKIQGYTYVEDTTQDLLTVYNSNYYISISPVNRDFSLFKNTDLTSQLNDNGDYVFSNWKKTTLDGIEMSTYEFTDAEKTKYGILAYTSYPNNNFTMIVSIVNYSYVVDYDSLKEAAKIINNSIFNGDTSKFKKDIN